MLCFILDTPHRGRYFHDCNTPETFGSPSKIHSVHLNFYRSSAADAFPAGFNHAAPMAEKPSQKSGPDSPTDVSQKL
jgi:hypothetical protein